MPRLKLYLDDLEGLPQPELPADFVWRAFSPGDETRWIELHREGDPFTAVTPDLFNRAFGDAREALAQRQIYLTEAAGGETIGSVTAWMPEPHEAPELGRIHWLIVHRAWQGRGLGRALLLAGCQRLRELGYRGAYLTTASERVGALRLYRAVGFRSR